VDPALEGEFSEFMLGRWSALVRFGHAREQTFCALPSALPDLRRKRSGESAHYG
jgi:hypothetical protein